MSLYRELVFILSRKETNIQTSGQVQKAYFEDKSVVSDSCYPISTSINLIASRGMRSPSLPFILAKRSEKMAVYYLTCLWRETKSRLKKTQKYERGKYRTSLVNK